MLANRDAIATIAVRNAKAASQFYEGVLGFKPVASDQGSVLRYRSGQSTLLVYESKYAGTNQATSATWGVGDELDEVVKTLKARGVVFEHYDLPGLTRQGDVHVVGTFKAAWFKDPDGNILHVNSG